MVFQQINSNFEFMELASSFYITIGLALICAFMPLVIMVFAATGLVLLHFYSLSMPIMAVSLIIFVLLYIFFLRFMPQKSWIVLLVPLAYVFEVPYILPVVFGLLGTPAFAIPVVGGTVVYHILYYVQTTTVIYDDVDIPGMIEAAVIFTQQILSNQEMWATAIVLAVSLLIVYGIRTRAIPHAWKIASLTGAIGVIVLSWMGSVTLEVPISYNTMIVNGVIAIILGLLLEFIFFSVDYTKTEHLQFEDSEYYYYVKAIPKLSAAELEGDEHREKMPPTRANERHEKAMPARVNERREKPAPARRGEHREKAAAIPEEQATMVIDSAQVSQLSNQPKQSERPVKRTTSGKKPPGATGQKKRNPQNQR